MKTRLAVLLAIVVLAGICSQAALGYWTGAGTAGTGAGGAEAATLNQGAAPTAGETGSADVFVKWGSSNLSNGVPADGYLVKRFDAETGTQAAIGAGCAGTITATSCEVPETPVGNWEYSVTPVFGDNWRGIEGLKSGAVDTGPGSMSLSRELFGGTVAPLPSAVSGTVSGFEPGESIAFYLDGTVPLTGSPAEVGPDGTATISTTVPAGTADGPHSLSVVSNSAEASAGILVDNTPPTIVVVVNPPPNAAGWNNTSPVEISGTVNDGNGSGLDFAKYTTDGSDPRTSPTAQYATEPVLASTSRTAKFYLVDKAGNESPVETQQVRIDTAPPYFTVETIEVEGGYYEEPGDPATGIPGTTYYRGAAAGSFRLRLTPVPMGGSPAVSAGFSDLDPNAIGFSFDSTTVTTPVGGPFVSGLVSWVAGTTANGGGAVSLTNEAGSTFGASGVTYNDSTLPSGGSVVAGGLTGSYSTSTELELTLAKGTDSGSGLADGSAPRDLPAKLLRASAPLSSGDGIAAGSCGSYTAYVQVGGDDPGTNVSDTVPADKSCYLYRYLVPDHVGNVATYSSAAIKVQTAAAATLRPTDAVLTPVSGTAAQAVSGSTLYYNPAQLGSFTVDTSVSAPYSGVAQVLFPAVTGFSGGGAVTSPLSGTTFRSSYSWSANGAGPSPGAQAITATNNAGQTSTNAAAFTLVKDDAGPSGGSVDATGLVGSGGRYSRSLTLSVAFAPGTDAGAGLAAGGARLLRASASLASDGLADGSCGTFGAYTQVGAIDPATPKSDTVPADNTCYRYQYLVSDKVGNQTGYLSPEIKVDASAPAAPALSFSALSNAYWSGTGTVVYYRPIAGSGGFQVNASATDLTAGISSYGFPSFPSGWTSTSAGFAARGYSWSAANPTGPTGAQTVVVTNNAGATASSSFTTTPDSTLPTAAPSAISMATASARPTASALPRAPTRSPGSMPRPESSKYRRRRWRPAAAEPSAPSPSPPPTRSRASPSLQPAEIATSTAT